MFAKTSALDGKTEAELMQEINSTLLDRRRTSIFIAHRWVLMSFMICRVLMSLRT